MAPSDQTHGARHLSMMRSLGLTKAEPEVGGSDPAYRFQVEMYAYYLHRDNALEYLQARRMGRNVSGIIPAPYSIRMAQLSLSNAIGFASR